MSEPRQKSDIVMDIFKIAINKIPQENITKEQIVETLKEEILKMI